MRWLPPFIWAGIITYLSLMPANNLPDYDLFHLLFVDKWIHAIFYFILALLLFYAWNEGNSIILKAVLILFVCVLFGTGIEIIQNEYTTSRRFEWLDIVFDTIGAIAYVSIWLRRRSLDFLKKS